jgi:hypothetical protein
MVRRADGGWDGFNASSPGVPLGPPDPEYEERGRHQPYISILHTGIALAVNRTRIPPIEGCPKDGPTICNKGGVDVSGTVKRAISNQGAVQEKALEEAKNAYDLRALYNVLVKIKRANPEETVAGVGADTSIPAGVISSVLGAIRTERPGANADGLFDDDATFHKGDKPQKPQADPSGKYDDDDPDGTKGLFPDLIFLVIM